MAKKKVKGVRTRFAGTDEEGRTIFKRTFFTLAKRWIRARERDLLKAGYRKDEISFKDTSGTEIGLISFTLRQLKRLELLKGRRKHIKDIIKDFRYTREQAIDRALKDFEKWGGVKGFAQDYVEYYYGRYG